ncbi:hypothetical protein KDA_19940 [Dictyobacter alpinus]|uniref:non-specific serine/threonine protein kinase n=1 Tax=Dictyobacter alpinus TaxID=2014873 RepID=A0A402B588_9CHLR|nr:serine/threonine-protein kinase [Dictyobacter alpinus]GCE26510.1 hypothetical protein KDA_19940 [Dictyobacter alpinus]
MNDIQASSVAGPQKQFGNYHSLYILGRGGFADVHLGEHVFLHTLAAIKVLRTELTFMDEEAFLDEARILARLRHPHIVQVLDFGLENHTPYLVMAYAPGGTMRQLHPPESRLSPAKILEYLEQLASAIQYIHDMGYIHRDIKPENVLLGADNELLLSDFSIAISTQAIVINGQVCMGTIDYMAPELLGLEALPGPASDQYALAIMVYEWLYGAPPFTGSVDEVFSQQLFASPLSQYADVLDVPLAVEKVVFKALAKNPQQRFASVQDFADAFRSAVNATQRLWDVEDASLPTITVSTLHPGTSVMPRTFSQPLRAAPYAKKKRNNWHTVTSCFGATMLVVLVIICVGLLAGLDARTLVPVMSVCMLAFPVAWAWITKNRFLFFLVLILGIVPALLALIAHLFLVFPVSYMVLLILCFLMTFTVSVNKV